MVCSHSISRQDKMHPLILHLAEITWKAVQTAAVKINVG